MQQTSLPLAFLDVLFLLAGFGAGMICLLMVGVVMASDDTHLVQTGYACQGKYEPIMSQLLFFQIGVNFIMVAVCTFLLFATYARLH